jgi:para-aminobenzoate synthetase component 1
MNTLPLICFHKNGSFIVSHHYRRYLFSGPSWLNKLEQLASKEPGKMIVLAISYESGHPFHGLHTHHDFAYLFILDHYELRTHNNLLPKSKLSDFVGLRPMIKRHTYRKKIDLIHQAIARGDVYQLNFTFPFEGEYRGSPESLFSHFTHIHSGNYHALIPLEKGSFHCFSPELFLEKTGRKLISRPIKGTSLPGKKSVNNLLNSTKEQAELAMIVDLIRNDLHRTSRRELVQINFHRKLMELGNLVHTYSELEIQTHLDLPGILRETLPGGSISGCPKRAAMKLIKAMESTPRGLYTGTIGWWNGDEFSLNIAIRSMFLNNSGQLCYGTGGGIVYESQRDHEYDEALLKAEKVHGSDIPQRTKK